MIDVFDDCYVLGGQFWHAPAIVARLANYFEVRGRDRLCPCKVFLRAYAAYYTKTSLRHELARTIIRADVQDYIQFGIVPDYVKFLAYAKWRSGELPDLPHASRLPLA